MGSELSRRVSAWRGRHVRRVLLVGLDAAGKTTLLRQLRRQSGGAAAAGDDAQAVGRTVPTTEAAYEEIKIRKLTLLVTDVGGQSYLRPYWRHHFTGAQGIVFVVDSTDEERFGDALAELQVMLVDKQVDEVPVVVFANKQDGRGAKSLTEIETFFVTNNSKIGKRPVKVMAGSALTGDGVFEAMDWLMSHTHRV